MKSIVLSIMIIYRGYDSLKRNGIYFQELKIGSNKVKHEQVIQKGN